MSNMQLVQHWYEALERGDLASLQGAFSADIEWHQAEGHPYQPSGEPWVGQDAVRDCLLIRIATEWDDFVVDVQAVHDAGATMVVEGRYIGTFRATGRQLNSQFCHVWQVREGKLARFRQYTDTAQLLSVTSGSGPVAAKLVQELYGG